MGDLATLATNAPAARAIRFERLRAALPRGRGNLAATILFAGGLLYLGARFADWAIVNATLGSGPEACRAAAGACWSFIEAKARFIIFGTYPSAEHWRPLAAVALICGALLASANPGNWRPWLAALWIAALGGVGILMWGGVFGLPYVAPDQWGGLPVTVLLATVSLSAAFPLGILLALGRRGDLPLIRGVCTIVIEVVRGLPLISLFFMTLVIVPLVFPDGVTIDKLFRALFALTIFAAAYLAEVVRGGLQGVPRGQAEAAAALGLGYWRTVGNVVLPQALRIAIPPLTNTIIVMVKNTALVLVIGIFDLFNAAKAAVADPLWPAPFAEAYLFVACIYFGICYAISSYSGFLEKRFVHNIGR